MHWPQGIVTLLWFGGSLPNFKGPPSIGRYPVIGFVHGILEPYSPPHGGLSDVDEWGSAVCFAKFLRALVLVH